MAFISQFSCLFCYPALNQVPSDSASLICRCPQVQCSVVKASPSSAPTPSTPAVAGAVSDHQYEGGARARVGLVAPIDGVFSPGNTGLEQSHSSFQGGAAARVGPVTPVNVVVQAEAWTSNPFATARAGYSRSSAIDDIPSWSLRKKNKMKRAAYKSNSRMHGVKN